MTVGFLNNVEAKIDLSPQTVFFSNTISKEVKTKSAVKMRGVSELRSHAKRKKAW